MTNMKGRITITLSKDLLKKIEEKRDGIPRSVYIEMLIKGEKKWK